MTARPLHRFPLADTRKIDEMHAVIQRLFGEHSMEVVSQPKNFHAQLNFCKLQSIGLYSGKYGSHIRVAFPNVSPYIIGIPIRGKAQHEADGVAQQMSMTGLPPAISSGAKLSLDFADDFDHLALYIDPSVLRKKLAALIGMTPQVPLKFDASATPDRTGARILRRLITLLVEELDASGGQINPLSLSELEQAIMVCYLCSTPNNYSRWLSETPDEASPWQVKLCEEYIEANWDQPITIEALTFVTNSSARSIFHAFKSCRGYSPMFFLKRVRLRKAHQLLSDPNMANSVTDVAFACGFNNLGHFAKDYFEVFGERPSTTRNNARGRVAVQRSAPARREYK